jgi:hypothetical protein
VSGFKLPHLPWLAWTLLGTFFVGVPLAFWGMHNWVEQRRAKEAAQGTHRKTVTINPQPKPAQGGPPELITGGARPIPLLPRAPAPTIASVIERERPLPPRHRLAPCSYATTVTVEPSPSPTPLLANGVPEVPEPSAPSPAPAPQKKQRAEPKVWLHNGSRIVGRTKNAYHTGRGMTQPLWIEVSEPCFEQINDENAEVVSPGTWITFWPEGESVRDLAKIDGRASLLVPGTGKEVLFDAQVLWRDDGPPDARGNRQYGREDATAGLPGDLVVTDKWYAARKALDVIFLTMLSTSSAAIGPVLQKVGTSSFSGGSELNLIIAEELADLLNCRDPDSRYRDVPAKTKCYVTNRTIVAPELASIGGTGSYLPNEDQEDNSRPLSPEEMLTRALQAMSRNGASAPNPPQPYAGNPYSASSRGADNNTNVRPASYGPSPSYHR